jgi:hypothetical protein
VFVHCVIMYVLLRPMVKAPLCRKDHKLRYLPGTGELFTEHLLNLQEYLYYLPVPFTYRQEHPFPLFRIGSAIYNTAPTIFRNRSTDFRDRSDISRRTSIGRLPLCTGTVQLLSGTPRHFSSLKRVAGRRICEPHERIL